MTEVTQVEFQVDTVQGWSLCLQSVCEITIHCEKSDGKYNTSTNGGLITTLS